MANQYLFDFSNPLFENNKKFWSNFIMILTSISFLLSDWITFYTSVGDFILIFILLVLIVLGQIDITKKQLIWLSIPFIITIFTITANYFFNDYWFSPIRTFLSSGKFFFYLVMVVMIYNFINKNELKTVFLKFNNTIAIAAIILGITLSVSVYTGNKEFREFIWYFTRTDYRSYLFQGNDQIIRTRSLFSEPAHLGYYLNVILSSNFFHFKKNINPFIFLTLLAGILLTFSYSMIAIAGVSLFIYFISEIYKGNFEWKYRYILILVLLAVFFVIFKDFIYETIIERTFIILSGEDGSAFNRIIESWIYVNPERFMIGNTIGHTPPITNIFAYALSDFGILGLAAYLSFTVIVFSNSFSLGVYFLLMNISKGGYLNPLFWMFIIFLILYGMNNDHNKRGIKNV